MSHSNYIIILIVLVTTLSVQSEDLTDGERLNIIRTSRENIQTLEVYRKKFNTELHETKNLIVENFGKLKSAYNKATDATNTEINGLYFEFNILLQIN